MPYKILIAEENRGVAQAKKNCLEGHDFQVELVARGADILTVLFTNDYDLLIDTKNDVQLEKAKDILNDKNRIRSAKK